MNIDGYRALRNSLEDIEDIEDIKDTYGLLKAIEFVLYNHSCFMVPPCEQLTFSGCRGKIEYEIIDKLGDSAGTVIISYNWDRDSYRNRVEYRMPF